MDMASAIWAISANNCFGMFVFGICFGLGFGLVNWPARRYFGA